MKVGYGVTLLLAALIIAGNDRPGSAQGKAPNVERAQRRMALYTPDPFAGRWKLNVAKSKFIPGPPLKSGTVEIEEQSGGFKCVLDPVDAQGNARHGEWVAKYDGKDYPARMTPFADAIALSRVDADTLSASYKNGGKEILSERWLVSKDGKTLTMIQKAKNPPAQGIDNTLVYEKQ